MSGGTFDYDQHKILNIIDKINESDPIGRCYSEDTIQEFNKAIRVLNDAYTYAHRIDWLLSGDDSEESFHVLLKEDLIITSKDQKNGV